MTLGNVQTYWKFIDKLTFLVNATTVPVMHQG